jgi:chromosomal replication initiation ATPase DnaA
MPADVREIVVEIARERDVCVRDILSRCTLRRVSHARFIAIDRAKRARPEASLPVIGGWFDRDHTTVLNALRRAQALGLSLHP